MSTKKINYRIDVSLLNKIDDTCQIAEITRTQFFVLAAKYYIRYLQVNGRTNKDTNR